MAKTFYLKFGTGDPRPYTGLTPTFIYFDQGASGVTSPAIAEVLAGSGIYNFSYEPTISTWFLADGGGALAAGDRYISGALDPVQAVDERIGTTSDSFGSTSVDPSTLYGYAKRELEFREGARNFNKATAVLDVYSRGSSTLLSEKTLTNTISAATRT